MTDYDLEHTFGVKINGVDRCPLCPGERGTAGKCDHSRYSARQRRFLRVPLHLQAYLAALYNPDKRAASSELARLAREYQTLPPRHDCWCICPREDLSRGYPACAECLRLRRDQKPQEAPEFGRTGAVNAPQPDATMLDLIAGLLAA